MKRSPLRKKSKRLTMPKLRDKAWKHFSLYIRHRGSVGGYNKCVTCDIVFPISELHAGHFEHGKTKEFYFDEDNVHPQCPRCNHFLSGNLIKYTLFMLKEYGQNTIDRLMASKKTVWKRTYLEDLIKKYK